MYNVYIRCFKNQDGTLNTSSVQMFKIPSNNTNGFPVNNPTVVGAEDSADTFDFQMDCDSPYYDSLIQLQTQIGVSYDGDYIFYGRVLTISTSTMFHTKSVHCEGAYSFMNDSVYEAVPDSKQAKISYDTFLNDVLANHRSMLSADGWKAIYRGTTTIDGTTSWTPTTETRKFKPTSWTDTITIMRNLISEFGGHMRIRHNTSNGNRYLDWYKYYARDLGDGNRPVVSIGKNILDISSEQPVDDIFTRVIPIGNTSTSGKPLYIDGYKYTDKNGNTYTHSGKAFPVTLIPSLYTNTQLNDDFHNVSDYSNAENNYGVIYKPQTFSDANSQSDLWNKTKEWIKNCYFGIASSFTIKAVDMHIVDGNYPKILVGDCVDVYYKIRENGELVTKYRKLVCKSIRYDLFNPENNSYTFGIPSDILKKTYSGNKKKSASNSVGGSGKKNPDDGDKELTATFLSIADMIGAGADPFWNSYEAYTNFKSNGELSGTDTVYDPDRVQEGESWEEDKVYFRVRRVGKMTCFNPSVYVGVSDKYGICGYVFDGSMVKNGNWGRIVHWYTEKEGYRYLNESLMNSDKFQDAYRTIIPATNLEIRRNKNAPESGEDVVYVSKGKLDIGKYVEGLKQSGISIDNEDHTIKLKTNGSARAEMGVDNHNGVTKLYDNNGTSKIEQDASDGSLKTKNSNGDVTTEVNGQEQTVKAGKDSNNEWQVIANDKVTYTDKDGNVHTLEPGFVTAKDIHIEEIPSFRTKLAVIDTLIAGKVSAYEIESEIGYIHDLSGDTITAGTRVSADFMNSLGLYTIDLSAEEISIGSSKDGGWSDLGMAFDDAEFSEGTGTDAGKIILTLHRANGRMDHVINFNIADTQTYKDAISALLEEINIGSIIYSPSSGDTPNRGINPGQWVKVQGTWTDSQGQLHVTSSYKLIRANTDVRLIPENIKEDVEIFGVRGTYAPTLEDRGTITPGKTDKVIRVTLPTYYGMSQVTVAGDANLVPGNIKSGTSIFGVEGTYAGGGGGGEDNVNIGAILYTPASGDTADRSINPGQWVKAQGTWTDSQGQLHTTTSYKLIKANTPSLEDKGSITPGTSAIPLTPSSGYYGISNAVVLGDVRLIPENIKKNVEIFGVRGTYAPELEDRGRIIPGKTDKTITATQQTYYGMSQVIVAGDANLLKENIKSGTSIFGVTGTFEGGDLEDKGTIRPTTSKQNLSPSTGYYGIGSIAVEGDADLIPANIKKNVEIFGVKGTYEGGTTVNKLKGSWVKPTGSSYYTIEVVTDPLIEGKKYTVGFTGHSDANVQFKLVSNGNASVTTTPTSTPRAVKVSVPIKVVTESSNTMRYAKNIELDDTGIGPVWNAAGNMAWINSITTITPANMPKDPSSGEINVSIYKTIYPGYDRYYKLTTAYRAADGSAVNASKYAQAIRYIHVALPTINWGGYDPEKITSDKVHYKINDRGSEGHAVFGFYATCGDAKSNTWSFDGSATGLYREGYSDGYSKGYTDGAASVQPSYTLKVTSKGLASSQEIASVISGYDSHLLTGIPASQMQSYRYILFTVGGKKKAFYFA